MNGFINSNKNESIYITISVILSVCLIIFTLVAGIRLITGTKAKAEAASNVADETNGNESGEVEETSSETVDKLQKTPWYLVLVNKDNPIPDGYVPILAKVDGNYEVDERIANALNAMLKDCRKNGLDPMICSAYRTNDTQVSLFEAMVKKYKNKGMSDEEAVSAAKTIVAYPGTSEHQLGLAVDIVSTKYQVLDQKQEETKVYQWLKEHCAEYGFIVRYPNGKTDITGIIYEPWHFRYVGREAAWEIMSKGITLEEYLESQN